LTEPKLRSFDYDLIMYDADGEFLGLEEETVYVESLGDDECDRGNANLQAFNLGASYQQEANAEDFSMKLTKVY